MKKYTVNGKVACFVSCEVTMSDEELEKIKAEDEDLRDAIIEKANSEFGGISHYAGNGGTDKLIGVSGYDESIYASDEYEFNEVEELDDENA